jgi:TonB family protein
VVDPNGRVSSARILRGGTTGEAFRLRATEELQTWEFHPAMRNGEPIDVDIVVEIPFRFQTIH